MDSVILLMTSLKPMADRIVDMISNGELNRSERVREVEISRRLGVSRIPVREAMRELESQGVLKARERGGMNVKAFSKRHIDEISNVRAALEPIALRQAVPYLTRKENRIGLNAILEEMKWAVGQNDRIAIATADLDFHSYLIELSDNDLIRNIWSGLKLQLQIIFRLELCIPTHRNEMVTKHQRLRDVLFDGTLDRLDGLIADHVRPIMPPIQNRSDTKEPE